MSARRFAWLLALLLATSAALPRERRPCNAELPARREAALPPIGVKWTTVVIDIERVYVGWSDSNGRRRYCEMPLAEFQAEARERQAREGD